jgi:hypothetical protein
LLIAGPVALGPLQAGIRRQAGEPLSQAAGCVNPEDAVGVVILVTIDILDGELGLADAPHAGKSRGSDADGLTLLENLVERVEVFSATDEVVVSGEQDEERRARIRA